MNLSSVGAATRLDSDSIRVRNREAHNFLAPLLIRDSNLVVLRVTSTDGRVALSMDRSFLLRPSDLAPILGQPRMLGDDMKPTAQLRQLEHNLRLGNIDAPAAPQVTVVGS